MTLNETPPFNPAVNGEHLELFIQQKRREIEIKETEIQQAQIEYLHGLFQKQLKEIQIGQYIFCRQYVVEKWGEKSKPRLYFGKVEQIDYYPYQTVIVIDGFREEYLPSNISFAGALFIHKSHIHIGLSDADFQIFPLQPDQYQFIIKECSKANKTIKFHATRIEAAMANMKKSLALLEKPWQTRPILKKNRKGNKK